MSSTPSRSESARINLCTSPEAKALIERAAAIIDQRKDIVMNRI